MYKTLLWNLPGGWLAGDRGEVTHGTGRDQSLAMSDAVPTPEPESAPAAARQAGPEAAGAKRKATAGEHWSKTRQVRR